VKKSQRILFFYPLKLLSLLPLQALYFICYPVYFLLYYVFKYRRKVTAQNLRNSFPDKNTKELKEIEKRYYKHLSRLLAEIIKGISISEKEIRKRVVIHDRHVLEEVYNKHGAALMLLGHFGNWEMIALSAELIAPHHFCIVYKPLSNSFFNALINETRERFGAETSPMEFTHVRIKNLQSEKVLFTLVADQNPSNTKNAQWVDFLNQDTAFLSGPKILSKRYNLPVLYLDVKSSKSGYYEIYPKVILEDTSTQNEVDILQTYAKMLEETIRNKPEFWLWSHRRWKHSR